MSKVEELIDAVSDEELKKFYVQYRGEVIREHLLKLNEIVKVMQGTLATLHKFGFKVENTEDIRIAIDKITKFCGSTYNNYCV